MKKILPLITILVLIGILMNFKNFYFISLLITFYQMAIFQIKNLDISKPNSCLEKFKSNNLLGLIIFINIFIGKIT